MENKVKEVIKENYALYNGDCVEISQKIPDNSVDFSFYSPPFASMYVFSGDERDLSNCKSYDEFFEHYNFVVKEVSRILKPGRLCAIHCMDIPQNGDKGLIDFPGDLIKCHQKNGFVYWDRKLIWKDPLMVALRTRQRALIHGQLIKDTTKSRGGLADYLIVFKKTGENLAPITKPEGLTEYFGNFELMNREDREKYIELKKKYINWKDDKTNRLSQFIWYRYASSNWEDIRPSEMLSFRDARDENDERHSTPTQLDIIRRSIQMYTNKGDVVFTPFSGVGSEVYESVKMERKGLGIELKPSYFRQSVKNLESLESVNIEDQVSLFDVVEK